MKDLQKIIFRAAIVIALTSVASIEPIEPFQDDFSMFDLKPNFKRRHPFLYFDQEDIPVLRLATKSSHKFLADDIKKITNIQLHENRLPPRDYETFAAKWNEHYGNNLPVMSMYCILYPEDKKVFEYVMEYMDRLAVFERWQTISDPEDEVPVAHILIGFVTTFDFLHSRFDSHRQLKYIRQIINKTHEMYEMSNKRWWGKAYLQNHVYTNLVALLTASLVIEPYDKIATLWKKTAVKLLERNMYLLGYVADGSITESDHYHAYSTRSITQYVYLCKRHMAVDHTSHPWLKSAFWYYYGIVLPGLKEPVGFADCQPGWSYGYEANLFFLDRFVLRSGNANWLGMKIMQQNKNRAKFARSDSILSVHLEYLWYDQSLKPIAPSNENIPTLYKYPDMGVVTFRTSTELILNNTFLSFKSGKLHGAFISKLVNDKPKWLNGWSSFNPGHEQPDRNSFTFAPHGVAMVTEGVKNYKYTYLDNTLMFKPSGVTIDSCVGGWIGQIGECNKYLKYGKGNPTAIEAEIVTSTLKDKIVHVAGEAKGAYHPNLQLESFYRNLLLLTPEVMVVVDHMQFGRNSPIQFISSFINNRYFGFKKRKDASGMEGIGLDHPRHKDYRIAWVMDDLGSSTVNITNDFTSPMLKSAFLNNINITFERKLGHLFKRIAYIFYGPGSSVDEFLFTNTSKSGVVLKIIVNSEMFEISIPTNYRDPLARKHFLNHDGFYSLEKNSVVKRTKYDIDKRKFMSHQSDINKINLNAYSIGSLILNLNKDQNTKNNIFTVHSVILKGFALTVCFLAVCFLRKNKLFIGIRYFPFPVKYIFFLVIFGTIFLLLMY